MKKVVIIICLSLMLIGCKSNNRNYFSDYSEDKEETLESLIENVGYPKIKCDELTQYEILGDIIYSNYILLSDGYVYEFVSDKDKLFSNGEQCKIFNDSKKFVQIKDRYLIDENNQLYSIDNNEYVKTNGTELLKENDIVEFKYNEHYKNNYSKDGYKGKYYYNEYKSSFYILKTDGNLYEIEYKARYYYGKEVTEYTMLEERIIISKDDYGAIKFFAVNGIEDEQTINILLTDKGIYELKDIETEECIKYEDIKCEKRFVLNERFKKYQKDFKYFGVEYILTKDNSLIKTSFLINNYF